MILFDGMRAIFITFLLLRFLDLWVFWNYNSVNQWSWPSFGLSLVFELLVCTFLYCLQRGLNSVLQWILAGAISLGLPFFILSQGFVFRSFGEFTTGFMLIFLRNDPQYLITSAMTTLRSTPWLVPPLFLTAVFLCWLWRAKAPLKGWPRARAFGIAALSLTLALVMENQIKHETTGLYKTALAANALAVSHALAAKSNNKLHIGLRERLQAMSLKSQPNVFLFIGESFGKKLNPLYDPSAHAVMPFLAQMVKSQKSILFKNAYTNSSATDVSLPSLLTGVGPDEGSEKLHRLPLLWDWFKAMGYTTIFVTPQKLAFAGMEQFLASGSLDKFVSAEKLHAATVNDNGVDDMLAANAMDQLLSSVPAGKPVLLVYFSNATHFPFLTNSEAITSGGLPAEWSRYEKALFITDKTIERIYQSLQAHRFDKDLLSVFTADHGEVEFSKRKVPRISSFY